MAVLICFGITLLPTTRFSIAQFIVTAFNRHSTRYEPDILDYVDPLIGTVNGG